MAETEAIFKTLARAAALKPEQVSSYEPELEGAPEAAIEKFLLAFAGGKGAKDEPEVYGRLASYMVEQRFCKIPVDWLSNVEEVDVMVCSAQKAYQFDPTRRAYCLYGRAVSGIKKKIKEADNERGELLAELENAMFQLHSQNLLPLSKGESHNIDDITLKFDFLDTHFAPALLSSQVFSPFMPSTYALVVVLPVEHPRHQQLLSFVRGSLLHVYAQEVNLLQKVVYRENFYKNSTLKGIYFVEEGEVESGGGRVIARGWLTNGKCKTQGYGWKFKPLPFIKAIAKSDHIWKQFLNDCTLNKEYPFKMSALLGLNEEHEAFDTYERRGKRGLRLPKIHRSFDFSKLAELEKVKHYDQKLNDLCDFKEKMLMKKAGRSRRHNPFGEIASAEANQTEHQKRMIRNRSSTRAMLQAPSHSSSSQNILIMSVLKKLEGLTEHQSKEKQREEPRERRDKIKISPFQLYEKSRIMKKMRYNQ